MICSIKLLTAQLVALIIAVLLFSSNGGKRQEVSPDSPFSQALPRCVEDYKRIETKSTAKALLCPMIRDEEGFLSEWVAYYQMHGFSHFVIMDDSSIDNSLAELKPWIDKGIVSVRANWTVEKLRANPVFLRNDFKKAMVTKALLETECKLTAMKMGYDFYVSLDIDEYMIPFAPYESIIDQLTLWFNETGRSIYCIEKFNFGSAPHILEPVNLLTIEAYQSRMPMKNKMNYYTSTAPKCAYRMTAPNFNESTSEFVAECCHFHGCHGWEHRADVQFCGPMHKGGQMQILQGQNTVNNRKWMDLFVINHYSRSIEKYALKSKTWKTATGEAKEGESGEQAAKSYDIPKFLSRNVGWHHDPVALRYTCQLRELLANMTGLTPYLRPGNQWYRNPEFGKVIDDPDKRGRYGRPNPEGFKYGTKNPYHYHGEKAVSPHLTTS